MIKLKLPTRIELRVGKFFYIQLNPYRNWCTFIKNKLKEKYQKMMQVELSKFDKLVPPIRLSYKLRARTKRRRDLGNMCYIVDKFFTDSMVNEGLIEDDNYFILPDIRFKFEGLFPDMDKKTEYEIEVTVYDRTDTGE